MKFFLFIIKAYQLFISPLFGAQCRFYPSCSEYFKQAVKLKGFLRGAGMGAARILRCHPFSEGGYDPAVLESRGTPR